jgi:GT2 family glycosyltransferase
MVAKVQKYSVYISQFLKSPIKRVIVQELSSEIREKGFVSGIQSFLHKRSEYFFPGYDKDSGYAPITSTKKYNHTLKFQLPPVQKPKVSIIVPMYNQIEYTYYCIRSIFEHNDFKDYEVIIADDNSPENTDFLRQHMENVVYIKNEKNLGFLKNCNNAAKHAKGDYIVFLNNDTVVKKDWLIELLNVFENFDMVGLVGSKLIYPNGKLQEAGGIIWQDGSGWNYGNQDHADRPEYNYVKEVDYISGAAIMINAELWKEIGGFDERYTPAYCEDSDLCFEVRKKGYKVMYQPFSVVVHFEGVSHGKDLNSGIKQYQAINNQKLKEKWAAELKLKSKNGENVFFEHDRTCNKKHVLIVDHNLPTVDQDAGSRTMSNYVDSLLSLGHSVKFLSTNPHPQMKYKKPLQEKGVEVSYCIDNDLSHFRWEKYLKDNYEKFDVILLSRSSVCIPLMVFLRNNHYKGKIIYYGHDLGYLRLDQETIINDDIALSMQSKKLKAEEDFMYEYADHSLVISYEEMRFLKKYISQPLHYIPPYFFDVSKEEIAFENRDGIMFIGGFNHPPNQDAIQWFMEEVYEPLFNLNIKMTIAGSNVPEFVYEYKKRFNTLDIFSNISGENLNNLYSRVRLSIVPLRVGAGVKGKVIEAMSKGVPVVGTFTAFEGLPKDETFPYKGVNTPKEMQFNILEAYSDKERWEKYSQYGKDYVLKYFNRTGMANTFEEIIG